VIEVVVIQVYILPLKKVSDKSHNIILAFFHSYKGLFWHEATSKCGWWFQVHSIACGITGV
jgi:hypothetical protein